MYNVQLVLHCLPSPWSDNATCREHSSVDAKIFETCTATAIMDLWVGWGTGYCSLGTGQGALCSACPGGRTGQSQPCGGLIMECTPHNVQCTVNWYLHKFNSAHRTMCFITLPSLTKCCVHFQLDTGHGQHYIVKWILCSCAQCDRQLSFLFSGGTSMTVECALAVNYSDQPWPRMKLDPLLRYNLIAKRILQNFGGWRY